MGPWVGLGGRAGRSRCGAATAGAAAEALAAAQAVAGPGVTESEARGKWVGRSSPVMCVAACDDT